MVFSYCWVSLNTLLMEIFTLSSGHITVLILGIPIIFLLVKHMRTMRISNIMFTPMDKMDNDIASLWKEILANVYGEELASASPAKETVWSWIISRLMQLISGKQYNVTYSLPNPTQNNNTLTLLPPDPDQWHRAMRILMQTAESGDALIPFTRHLTANQGLVYPAKPDPQYVKALRIPNGGRMDFDQIFDKTVEHLIQFWGDMSLSLQGKSSPLDSMPSVSLDTGINENNKMIYWS